MEFTPKQYKLATVVEAIVPKSPLFEGDLEYSAVGEASIRVCWTDTNYKAHSFLISSMDIERCADTDAAVEMILKKMDPGHKLSRKPKFPEPAAAVPAYTPSISPAKVFTQHVIACRKCETLADGSKHVPGMTCIKEGCSGTLGEFEVVQPKFPGDFKPFTREVKR